MSLTTSISQSGATITVTHSNGDVFILENETPHAGILDRARDLSALFLTYGNWVSSANVSSAPSVSIAALHAGTTGD